MWSEGETMKRTNFPSLILVTRTNFRRAASLSLTGLAMIVMLGLAAQKAYAHNIILSTGTPTCNSATGVVTIPFTATSWDVGSTFGPTLSNGALGPGDGEDPNIEIDFNGFFAGSGAFTDPIDSFSSSASAPGAVTSVLVTATAKADWVDGFSAASTPVASTTVDLTSVLPCGPAPSGNGRFTGGGKLVTGSVTVTKGFQVECDMDPQHETLELNWAPPVGEHFHMDTITAANCTMQGNPPNPPTADVNRIDGAGTGKYDGTPGYTVVFTLWDQGEPGGEVDQAGFTVCKTDPANPNSCSTSPQIVLSVPVQPTTTGNIQAHLDQGH
jgi:hypothetical protein